MNEGKLIADAWEAGSEDYFADDPRRDAFEEGFMRGARWHESLPLADRLTEDEKKRLKNRYAGLQRGLRQTKSIVRIDLYRLEIHTLEYIFGKNLFTPTEQ